MEHDNSCVMSIIEVMKDIGAWLFVCNVYHRGYEGYWGMVIHV
ncbi:hypothetical protein [Virgibacillus halodenitrificans]|nr:hypothetical protein [Virgibacillus halodenitrificans]